MKLFEQTQTLNYSWDVVTTANWMKYPNPISTHVLSVDILSREVDPETGVLRTERLLCCKQGGPAFLRTIGIPIPEVAWFREVSHLDPRTKEYTATTVNLTMRNIMVVKETCVYKEMREKLEEEVENVKRAIQHAVAESEKPPGLLSQLRRRGFTFGSAAVRGSESTLEMKEEGEKAVASPESGFKFTEFVQTAEFHAQVGYDSVKRMMEDAAVTRFKNNADNGVRALETVIKQVMEKL
ncbi:hypothetical protein HDU98_008540 [Podochytrium sp. JEL0797]|nr:hypothetical protein HDU98_008540 [Podochytrium sp. JEL0797]